MNLRNIPSFGSFSGHASKRRLAAGLRVLALTGMVALFLGDERSALGAAPQLATSAQVGPPVSPMAHWVLLTWHPEEGFPLASAHAIHRKPGPADSLADFALLAVVQPTADVSTLTLLMQSALAAGLDVAGAEQAVNGLLGTPPVGATLAEKLAVALTTNLPPPQAQLLYDQLPRFHPTLALALGRAYLAQVSSAEASTFEIRELDPGTGVEGAVVASVTTGLAPVPLPAPGTLAERVETSPRGHLRVLLRWCTPAPLAAQTLQVSGFNLYRARRAAWQTAEGSPPPLALSPAALVSALQSGLLEQVNRSPILPDDSYGCLGAVPPPEDLYFVADDNDTAQAQRYELGGEPFEPGEQVTYYAAALDHFRRPGAPGPGLEVVVCDRLPPFVPRAVQVENRPGYNEATQQGTQHLEVSWERQDPGEVTHYWVYRWNSHDDALRHAAEPSIENLLARIPNTGAGPRIVFADDGTAQLPAAPPAPALPGDAGRTFWYTVRAEDGSVCLSPEGYGNLSGPAAPQFGVLRDWSGPGEPGGRLTAQCCEVGVMFAPETGQLTQRMARLRWVRGTNAIDWVEVRESMGAVPIRRYEFPQGEASLSDGVSLVGLGTVRFDARFGTDGGHVSGWVNGLQVNASTALPLQTWTASLTCSTNVWPCGDGFADPVDPETGDLVGVCGEISPVANAVEWRVYRRMDGDGRLVQIESGKFPETAWCDTGTPAVPARMCYFVQVFNADGHASTITRLGCVDTLGTEPMPRPEIVRAAVLPSVTNAPVVVPAAVEWFCPPAGVERFEIAFRPPPPGAPDVYWLPVAGAQEAIGTDHGVYESPRIPAGFGNGGPDFAQAFSLKSGEEYRVRVRAVVRRVSDDGAVSAATGPWSDEVLVSFVHGMVAEGPQVPWPARPVPGLNPAVSPRAEYDVEEERGRVEIGTILASEVSSPGSETSPAVVRGVSLLPYLTVPLPFVVYRHETSPGRRAEMGQITPYVQDFLVSPMGAPGNPQIRIDDRLIMIKRRNGDQTGPYRIWIRDTQPVMRGKSYRYTVVRHRADREVADVLASNVAEVPQ